MCNNILNLPVGRSAGAHGPVRRDAINRLCGSLDDAAGRGEFGLNEDEYCLRFGLDKDERQAVKDRDFVKLIELGGYVVHLNKLAALSGMTTVEAIRKRRGGSLDSLIGKPLRTDPESPGAN